MTVEMQAVTHEGLSHVVHHLRARDRREIFALRWNDDEDQLIADIFGWVGDLWKMWLVDGEPAAVSGITPMRPGVAIAGAFGTDNWRQTVRPVTRWGRDFVIPALQRSGYHRLEVYVLADNTDSRRWLELFGAEVEALLKGYGRKGEDFLLYVRDLKETGHVFRKRRRPCSTGLNNTLPSQIPGAGYG